MLNYLIITDVRTEKTKENNMVQRIFDMENEQGVKDLFDLFPDHIKYISRSDTDKLTFFLHGGKQTQMAYGLKIK